MEASAATGATPDSVCTRSRRRSRAANGSRAPVRSTITGISRPDACTNPPPALKPSRPTTCNTGSTSSKVRPNASKARRLGSTHSSSMPGGVARHALATSGTAFSRATTSRAKRFSGAVSGPDSTTWRGAWPIAAAMPSRPPPPRLPRTLSSPGRSSSKPRIGSAASLATSRTRDTVRRSGRSSSSTKATVMEAPSSDTSDTTVSTPSNSRITASTRPTAFANASAEAAPRA